MKLTRDEIAAAAYSQFGIVADDDEINAFAEWLIGQHQAGDIVTVETGTIQQRTEQLIRDAEAQGLVVTISLHSKHPPKMGGYEMRADFRPSRVAPLVAPAKGPTSGEGES